MSMMLDPGECRHRQQRLCAFMQSARIDRVLFVLPEHVQWLTGFRPHRLMSAAGFLDTDGYCVLAAPNEAPQGTAADDVRTFPAQSCATLRQDQAYGAAAVLWDAASTRPAVSSLGLEFSACGPCHERLRSGARGVNIEPALWQLRRRKHADELALIGRAVACTEAMYRTARELIEPGITELELFNRLHAAAVETVGEPLTHPLGNDFQCNSAGGPPRNRPARGGELYILDLGPSYRGYYADTCRTFCVAGRPTDEQHRAWEAIVRVLKFVEQSVRPGVGCRSLYEQVRQMLDAERPGAFFHHLGHGFGLFPHEAPHLNPHWDDVFEEGDVFTAEPGLYGPGLKAGIRLEQDYRVTADGVERLTAYPLEM
jgi:Xaa-Pro aminopeptidase